MKTIKQKPITIKELLTFIIGFTIIALLFTFGMWWFCSDNEVVSVKTYTVVKTYKDCKIDTSGHTPENNTYYYATVENEQEMKRIVIPEEYYVFLTSGDKITLTIKEQYTIGGECISTRYYLNDEEITVFTFVDI